MPWVDAPTQFTRRNLFVDISGEEKTGKTTLAMSARPKIGVVDLNDGLDGVVQKAVKKRAPGSIQVCHHPLPQHDTPDNMRQVARTTWDAMRKDIQDGLKNKGSVVLDTGTEVYKLARYAELGGMKSTTKKGQLDYEQVNSRMRGLFHLFHAFKANLIITHQVKEEWVTYTTSTGEEKRRTTGKFVNNGWEDTGYDIQIALRTEKRVTSDGLHFVAILRTCRFDPSLEGTEFSSAVDQFNLPFIMGFVTDTETEVWEK